MSGAKLRRPEALASGSTREKRQLPAIDAAGTLL
jgi:hypothetical protein